MMLDIVRFVGFFLVVYFSFTFCTTYIYIVYEDFNQNSKFPLSLFKCDDQESPSKGKKHVQGALSPQLHPCLQ